MSKEIKINGFWLTTAVIFLFFALVTLSNLIDKTLNIEAGTSIKYIGGLGFISLVAGFFITTHYLIKHKHEQESAITGITDASVTQLDDDSKIELRIGEGTSISHSGESGGGDA